MGTRLLRRRNAADTTAGGVGAGMDTPRQANAEVRQTAAKPTWQANADAMRQRADELRKYSETPTSIDTSGQRDYWREFLDSRLARQQETDEQRARREKGERANRRIAALADGLIALSNITGAMAGATPVSQQATMSAAHKKAVDEAAAKRKANATLYDVARKNAATLALKQDEANAKRLELERERRRKAGQQADGLLTKAATLERLGGNADWTHGMAERRQDETERNHRVAERQGATRNAISSRRETRLSKGGSGGNQAAYDYWMGLSDDEKEAWRKRNNRSKWSSKDDKAFVEHVYKEHLGEGKQRSPIGGDKKKKSPTA